MQDGLVQVVRMFDCRIVGVCSASFGVGAYAHQHERRLFERRIMGLTSLRDAIARYHALDGAPANAYEWYRRDAHRSGTVWIGGLYLPVRKIGRTWHVDEADLERGLAGHRAHVAEVKEATDDYRRGVLHGKSGDQIELEGGGYRRRDPFHFMWSDYEVGRHKSDGSWYCDNCMRPAETESHSYETSWRYERTVTRVFCKTCGTERRSGLN